jgi:hypothetical protein
MTGTFTTPASRWQSNRDRDLQGRILLKGDCPTDSRRQLLLTPREITASGCLALSKPVLVTVAARHVIICDGRYV